MSSSQPIALLFPKKLQRLVMDGGAEIVVERRADGRRRLFLHLFDEVEREEEVRLHGATSTRVHEQILKELHWARATLWNDERLQRYLYSCDWMTWPSFSELSSMVDLVRSAKETDEVPDFVGANFLQKALDLIEQEILYPGLHVLREENLAGPLTAYEKTRSGICEVGDTLHLVLDKGDEHHIGSSVWVVDIHTPTLLAQEVLHLPLTTRVQEECVRVMQPGLAVAGLGSSWSAMVKTHQRKVDEHAPAIFYSITDCLIQFGMRPEHLAKSMSEAAQRGCRVRLRVGIYLTLLQRTQVYVMTRTSWKGGDTGNDDESMLRNCFEQVTGKSYDVCEAAGLLLHLAERETLEDALRLRFLSPLAAVHESLKTVSLTYWMQLTPVVVQHNPFGIIHGARVMGTFPENHEVRVALSNLLVSREGIVPAATTQPPQPATTAIASPTSSTLTGEQLRRSIDEAIFKTLSQEPMTKVTLSAHGNLARFRCLANFDAILKDSLKKNAECRGKKYYLKE